MTLVADKENALSIRDVETGQVWEDVMLCDTCHAALPDCVCSQEQQEPVDLYPTKLLPEEAEFIQSVRQEFAWTGLPAERFDSWVAQQPEVVKRLQGITARMQAEVSAGWAMVSDGTAEVVLDELV